MIDLDPMGLPKFPLDSDQLTLLMAFETTPSLGLLAEILAKDPSVVSRNLQRLAEDLPVLSKVKGRWQLTPLGRQVNSQTRAYLESFRDLAARPETKSSAARPYLAKDSVLIIINAQNALLDPAYGERNNRAAEGNIQKILASWRARRAPIFHVRHVSDRKDSYFFRESKSSEFIDSLKPLADERIIEKFRPSAFSETDLARHLEGKEFHTVVLAGFTANECIDATARQSAELGFDTYVVGDATAMFDFAGPNGKTVKADRVHRLVLANLNALCAKVIASEDLLRIE
jgi:nicotinamidase-related amidase